MGIKEVMNTDSGKILISAIQTITTSTIKLFEKDICHEETKQLLIELDLENKIKIDDMVEAEDFQNLTKDI